MMRVNLRRASPLADLSVEEEGTLFLLLLQEKRLLPDTLIVEEEGILILFLRREQKLRPGTLMVEEKERLILMVHPWL